jgi:hypothetical protein
MCAQDLETTSNEKRQEKKVEEVRRPQPQWIIKKHHWINILKPWFVGFPVIPLEN